MTGRQDDNATMGAVGEAAVAQVEVTRPLAYRVDQLLVDVRPLRALFEDLAFEIRTLLQSQGIADPLLKVALDLRYVGQTHEVTVPLPLEIEDVAVCLADPLPLDAQALRQAVATFRVAYQEQYGYILHDKAVEVVVLRVSGNP